MPPKGFRAPRYRIDCPCSNIIYVIKSALARSRFCSKECKKKFHVNANLGKVHSNSYSAIHKWIRKNKIKPELCEFCGNDGVEIQWANKSHEYKRELDDWIGLCISCHRKHDLDGNGMKRQDVYNKFPELRNAKKRFGNRLLTKEQVVDIYTSLDSQKELREKYNLSAGYICMIKKGVRYKKYTQHLEKSIVKPMYIKLSKELAQEIRSSFLSGRELAKIYSVSMTTISNIRNGIQWLKK